MTIRPGINLVRAAGLLVLVALVSIVWLPILWLLLVAVTVLVAATVRDGITLRTKLGNLTAERHLPNVAGRGMPFQTEIRITNRQSESLRIDIRDVRPPNAVPPVLFDSMVLPGGRSDTTIGPCHIAERGKHTFGPVWIRAHGPLQLLDGQQSISCPGTIKILPEALASRDEFLKDLGADIRLLDKITQTRRHDVGTEFESLAEYRYGDDPRRIDWRATARSRYPVIRRYQVERHRDVMLVVDCGRLMGAETARGTKLDRAVDASLVLARCALQSGDRCGIATYDDRVRRYLRPVFGIPSMRSVTECLYDVETKWRESDFARMFAELQLRQSKRSLIVVLSDVVDAETSRQLRASLDRLSRRHLVLFAALRTPLLRQIIARPSQHHDDGGQKAVVFRLLREREEALHALRRSGVHVVDVEPSRLTAPLINQFIDLRTRDLL